MNHQTKVTTQVADPIGHILPHNGHLRLNHGALVTKRPHDTQKVALQPDLADAALQRVNLPRLNFQAYEPFVNEDLHRDLDRLSSRLRGLTVGHVNATGAGGGVAEILRCLVPLMNELGINTEWSTIKADDDFFQVTKNLHNSLQGGAWQFTAQAHEIYLHQNKRIAEAMARCDTPLWIIHDPQPCPAIMGLSPFSQAIWRCHIDTSSPNQAVWSYISRYLSGYQRFVFSLPGYVNGSVPLEKARFLLPAIDPLTPKNQPLSHVTAQERLSELGIDPTHPLVTQVARFDPWKDPWGVIDAYRLVKQTIPDVQLALVGVMAAQDDPEAQIILEQVKQYAGTDPNIHLFWDPTLVGELEVNAFQTASDVILQKSLREGFGLTVTEAMWKGTPVIGGNCGGIRMQINDGVNGYLVDSSEMCAQRIVALLKSPDLRIELGERGRETVRQRFLMPRLLKDYLSLIEEVALGV